MKGMNFINMLIVFTFLFSCKGNSPEMSDRVGEKVIPVDVNNEIEISIYDLFSKVEIIPLEVSESSLLYEYIDKIIFHNNMYYVMPAKQNVLFVFDSQGKYVDQINKQGNGPGEYNELEDFNFNRFTGNLELMSSFGYINVYDSCGKTFKERLVFPRIPIMRNFTHLAANKYLFFSDVREDGKIVCYDMNEKKIVSEGYDLPKFLFFNTPYHHMFSPFYLCGEQVCFVQGYNGDVFTVEKDGSLSPRYLWDFGEYNFDISGLEEKPIEYYVQYARTDGSKYVNTFVAYGENSSYYMTRFKFKNKMYHLVLDKKDGSYKVFRTFKENVVCFPIAVDEDAAYSYVTPRELPLAINPDILDDENRKRYESVTMDSNPIIIRYTFKK